MYVKNKICSLLIAAAVLCGAAMPVQAQTPIPAVGIVNGAQASSSADDLCEEVTPASTVQVVASAQQERLWLPIFRDAREAPSCPAIAQGVGLMLEAGTSELRELIIKPGSPEGYLLTNVGTRLMGSEYVAPSVGIDHSIFEQPTPGSDLELVGVWSLGPIQPDSPADLSQWHDAEVYDRIKNERDLFLEIKATDKLNIEKTRVGMIPAGELCPEAFAAQEKWRVEYIYDDLNPVEQTWFTLITHHQLAEICPWINAYEWMLSSEGHKRLPPALLARVEKEIEEETYIYRRKMWTFPSLDNLVPEPATVTWTASTVGGAVLVYAVIAGGNNRFGSVILFRPLMQR